MNMIKERVDVIVARAAGHYILPFVKSIVEKCKDSKGDYIYRMEDGIFVKWIDNLIKRFEDIDNVNNMLGVNEDEVDEIKKILVIWDEDVIKKEFWKDNNILGWSDEVRYFGTLMRTIIFRLEQKDYD